MFEKCCPVDPGGKERTGGDSYEEEREGDQEE